jgi:two-component system sensor histidine kinase BaeS
MGWLRANLRVKLLLSYLLTVLVGGVTLFIAAQLVAPSFFAQHMARMMGGPPMMGSVTAADPSLDRAFRDSLMQALLVGGGVAALVAVIVSLFVAQQIARPVQRMLAATRRIASGHYAERVPIEPGNAGDEIGHLAESFNEMAASLEQTERRRLDLIGDISHELRTPIATIEGYLEGLLDGVVEPSAQTWALLHDEAGRLRRLVEDLQQLSRAEARQITLAIRPIASAAIVARTLDRLRPQFDEKGLTLRSEMPSDLPPVAADEDRAVQVLTNLLINALRYTPAPGDVTLAVTHTGDAVTFAIADTGIGFAPEQAPQLFDRFYRVDKSRSRALGGSGIGLTIARVLVEAMHGHISATSAGPGQGSTFAFTLPVAA